MPAPDWGPAFVAVWNLDEACNGTVPVTRVATAGTCAAGSDCDLTDINTVASDATNKKEGTQSAVFATANAERLECANATCDELRPGPGKSFTRGCWSRLTLDDNAFRVIMSQHGNTNDGFYFGRQDNVNRQAACAVGEGTAFVTAVSAANAIPANTFVQAACSFDNAANQVQTWINGQASGAAATQTDIATPPVAFKISTDSLGNEWNGQLDECFVATFALSATEMCRTCSCGIDGSLCLCTGSSYAATGRNASDCGTCALPPCSAGPPPTPTVTPSGTPTPVLTGTPMETPTETQIATPTETPTDTPTPTDSGAETPTTSPTP